MIQPNELRIGNYISRDGKIIMVSVGCLAVITGMFVANSEDIFTPIIITEKMLFKLGFDDRDYTYSYGGLHIDKLFTFWQWLSTDDCSGIQLNNCPKYLHQLQNLYYALTGEELILKDKASS